MTDHTDLIARLRASVRLGAYEGDAHEQAICGRQMREAADALEAQAQEIERLRSRLADEKGAADAYAMRLAEAERNEGTLLGMIHHQRDVLRECLPYLNESMAGKRPGRSADDIRAAVKALTSASADGPKGEK